MEEKFVLILPNIRSGHNVGAMFRTADGAGLDKIYITGYTPTPPHKAIDKVSLGAEKSVPWEWAQYTVPLLKRLKKAGYTIVALEQTTKSVSIYEWNLPAGRQGQTFPVALVVGNEKTGVTPNILKYCDAVVHLPMKGVKSSLNVSIAAGVAMYHIQSKSL